MDQLTPQAIQAFIASLYGNRQTVVVPYVYTVSITGLAQGVTSTQQLAITANADFLMLGVAYRANTAAAQNVSTKTAAFVRLLLTDSGSNEQYMGSPVDLENYAANGVSPRALPFPRWIGGRTSVTVQMTNYAPIAETYAIDLALHGVLIRTL